MVLGLAGELDRVRRDREALQRSLRQAIKDMFVSEIALMHK
jgi:hypothetical protein